MHKPTISLADNGGFLLEIPSQTVEGSHHVVIPFTLTGLSILRKVLQERQREARSTIGMNGSPTQAQVEAWLEAERKQRETETKPKPELLAGLNIEELDL